MIAKSDLIILMASTLTLGAGVYHWQQRATAPVPAAPVSARVIERAPPPVQPSLPQASPVATVAGRATNGTDDATRVAGAPIVVRRVSPSDPDPVGSSVAGKISETREAVSTRLVTTPAASGGETRPDSAGENALAANDDRALYGVYRVRSGDYLGKIANRFGTSVRALRSINDLDGTTIGVGQELRYPLPAN